MLRSFRDSIKGRTGKVLLAIIIVPFVLFGAESLLTGGGGAATVLEVNGEEVDAIRLAQEMQMLRNETASRMGENVDYSALTEERLRPQAIERLTQSLLVKQSFEKMSLSTPKRMIERSIVQTPEFQVDGKFSNEYMSRVLADNGFNLNMLKERLAEDMRLNQLRNAIGQSSFVADSNIELLMKIFNEKRRVDWLRLGAEHVQIDAPREEDLQAYYDANKQQFVTPRSVDAEYLLIDQALLEEPVEEAEIRAEYEQQMQQFEASERRLISHILLEVGGEQDEAQALQRARELAARITAGERFAELAKQYSDDSVSAEDGGELGYAEKDGTFPEAFEEAAFALAQGAVSEPVVTDAGVHLVTVSDIEKPEKPGFDEVRETIAAQIKEREARRRFTSLLERVADAAFNAADLREPAAIAGSEVKAVAAVTERGVSAEPATLEVASIFSNAAVLSALFSAEVLEDRLNSEMVELSETQAVVLRAVEVNEPRQQSLDEVRELVSARVREEQVAVALEELAGEVAGKLDSESFAVVASARGIEAEDVKEDVELNRQSRDVPPALREAIFSLPRAEAGQSVKIVADGSEARYIYRVDEVIDDAEAMDEEQRQFFAQQMAAMTANQEIMAFVQGLREGAKIQTFQ